MFGYIRSVSVILGGYYYYLCMTSTVLATVVENVNEEMKLGGGVGVQENSLRELQYRGSSTRPQLCRCLASWEDFPGLVRRHLIENNMDTTTMNDEENEFGQRNLQFYEYSNSKYDKNTGAIYIENVRVLPDSNAVCARRSQSSIAGVNSDLASDGMIFSQHDNNRNLRSVERSAADATTRNEKRNLQNYYASSSEDLPSSRDRLRPSPIGECSTFGAPGNIPTCCFSLCDGTEGGGILQPSGNECASCDCDCPSIPQVFECPRDVIQPSIVDDVCKVDVTIDCTVPGTGLRCGELEPLSSLTCNCPNNGCPIGYDFIYTGKDCRATTQNGVVNCWDSNVRKPDQVRIVVTGEGEQLFNGVVFENEPVYLETSGSSCIPERLRIEVTSTNYDVAYQVLVVKTSCDTNGVWLGDDVGSLEFTGFFCEDATKMTTCLEKVNFEVCAINEKNLLIPFDLTRLDLDVNGVQTNMLKRNVANLAKSHCVSDYRIINICNDLSFVAIATADGDDGGEGCSETTKVEFEIEGRDATVSNGNTCAVDVTLNCIVWDGSGTACEDIEPESSIVCNCDGNQAGGYDFKYTGVDCPTGSKQDGVEFCTDYNGDKPDLVRIVVTEGGSAHGRTLYSANARIGGMVLLGDIPERIRIDVTSLDSNTVYQTVMVNTRCDNSGIWLGGSFGAFTFTGFFCDSPEDGINCLKNINFEVCARNRVKGYAPLRLIEFTLEFNGEKSNLLDGQSLTVQPLQPSCVSDDVRAINICRGDREFTATARAVSDARDGACQDTTSLRFRIDDNDKVPIPYSTNSTECGVDVTVECTVPDGSGRKCRDIDSVSPTSLQCNCRNCASSYDFVYTGRNCPSTSDPGVISCEDSNGLKPQEVRIVVNGGGAVLYNRIVKIADPVLVGGTDDCIPNQLSIEVWSANSNKLYQSVVVNTRCSTSGIKLGDSVGSLDFTSFLCARGDTITPSINCLMDVSFKVCAINIAGGDAPFRLNGLTLSLNGAQSNILHGPPVALQRNDAHCVSDEVRKINICQVQDFSAMAIAREDDLDGGCQERTSLRFSLDGQGPTPTPPGGVFGMCQVDVTVDCTERDTGVPCENIQLAETDCLTDIVISVCSQNVGSSPFRLTNVTMTVDNTSKIGILTDETRTLSRSETFCLPNQVRRIDACNLNTQHVVRVQAHGRDLAAFGECNVKRKLFFDIGGDDVIEPNPSPTSAPDCDVEVDLFCSQQHSGIPCFDIPSTSATCSCENECARSYDFRYTGNDCSGSIDHAVICTDNGSIKPRQVRLVATALNSGRTLFDGNLRVGDLASLSDDSAACIPNKVEMNITSPFDSNVVYQRLVVDTRCRVGGIQLTDSAGAVDFNGYKCRNGAIHNCTTDVVFDTCSRNTGALYHDLTKYTLDVNGEVTDFLSGKSPRVLRTGVYCTEEVRTIDTCTANSYRASVSVEANQDRCSDIEVLSFDVDGSGLKPLSQNCSLDLELYCEHADTSVSCNRIPSVEDLTCDCISNCAETFKFLYTGEDCSTNLLPGVTSCTDNGDDDKPRRVWLTAKGEGGETLFDDIVAIGQEATLRDGTFCFPTSVTIEIRSTYQRTKLYQTLTLDTTCGGKIEEIKLNDAFGAVQFTGYTCAMSSLVRSCLTDVVFDICSTNSGQGSLQITNLTLSLEGNTSNLLEGLAYNMTIRKGGRQCRRTTRTINRCGRESRNHTALANVQAHPDGVISSLCTNIEKLRFATTNRSASVSSSTSSTSGTSTGSTGNTSMTAGNTSSTTKTTTTPRSSTSDPRTQRTTPVRRPYSYQRQSYNYRRQPYWYQRQPYTYQRQRPDQGGY